MRTIRDLRPVRIAAWVAAGLLLAGCDPSQESEAPPAAAPSPVPVAAWHLEAAGSEARVAEALSAGWQQVGSGALVSQRELGAPSLAVESTFGGAPVMAADGAGGSGGGSVAGGAGGGSGGGGSAGGEAFTNVQVAGVEEADVTKTDGEFLYVAEQPFRWIYPVPMPAVIADPVVMAAPMIVPRDGISLTDPVEPIVVDPLLPPPEPPEPPAPQIARYKLSTASPASATPLPPLTLPGIESTTSLSRLDLLLSGGPRPVLAALGQTNRWTWERWFAPVAYNANQQLRLWLFDMHDAENVPAPVSVVLKGELIDSRRVGDTLYVVSRYSPAQDTDPVLPEFTVDGTPHELADAAGCLLSKTAQKSGYPSLTMVTAINLHAPQDSRASCYVGEVYTMYMTRESLYLAAVEIPEVELVLNQNVDKLLLGPGGPNELAVPVGAGSLFVNERIGPSESTSGLQSLWRNAPRTVIHRFALSPSGPRYAGSGRVPGGFTGWLGAGSNPQWRFNERDGRLFVVTSWWSDTELRHFLFVLEAGASGDFDIVATLPNDAHPEPIGKPREDIHAIRYVKDRAYIVTFQRTDPLYVLDLSAPLDPRVAGTLELPGFSAYLHPVADGWLLGVGQGATAGHFEANLFDVRDITRPSVHTNLPICSDCNAPVMSDYHAIAVQYRDGHARVALPVQRWVAVSDDRYYAPLDQSMLLEAAPESLLLLAKQSADRDFTGLGRVFLVDDAVFQPQVGHVSAGDWPVVR